MAEPMRYPRAMRALHWLIALAVLVQFAVGMAMSGPDDEVLPRLYGWHTSVGVLILLLAMARVANRLRSRVPPLPRTMPAWERHAARIVHLLLYTALLAAPVLGYLAASAGASDRGVAFFGIDLPAAIAPDEAYATKLGEWHETVVWSFAGLLILHGGAVVRHAFFDRAEHDVLPRMF